MTHCHTDTRSTLPTALAALLLAGSLVGAGSGVWTSADLNGDASVDVLDVQAVVAHVLSEDPDSRVADVNGDGRLDVLDLQAVVAQAADSEVPASTPADTPRKATFPVLRVPRMLPANRLCLPRADENAPVPMRFRQAKAVRIAALRTQVERYLFTLTPHAPPRAA